MIMSDKKPLHDMGPPIKDEIPGLRDFFATSVLSGAISAAGVPASDDEEYCSFMAEFCYKMADAMMMEKYKKNTRH
jgi:hypothetical protein